METGSIAEFLDHGRLELPYQEQAIRSEIFDHLEDERRRMVEVLQDDIAQLVAIAKLKLSANNAEDVEDCLAMALSRLNTLSFEIKPQILEEFGLAATLRQLLNKRLANYCEIHVSELPANLEFATETVLFRLVQQILNTLPVALIRKFNVRVLITGSHICLKSNLVLQPNTEPDKQPNFIAGAVLNALKHIIYMFSGNATFQFFEGNEVEFLVCVK